MAGANTREFNESNFEDEVLKSTQPVVVDFWAEWCTPCKMLGPVIDEVANEYVGKVKVGKVDIDSNQSIAVQFGISSIPTVLLFQNGEIKERFIGTSSAGKRNLKTALDGLVGAQTA